MGEACEDCRVPSHRGGNREIVGDGVMQEKKSLVKGRKVRKW